MTNFLPNASVLKQKLKNIEMSGGNSLSLSQPPNEERHFLNSKKIAFNFKNFLLAASSSSNVSETPFIMKGKKSDVHTPPIPSLTSTTITGGDINSANTNSVNTQNTASLSSLPPSDSFLAGITDMKDRKTSDKKSTQKLECTEKERITLKKLETDEDSLIKLFDQIKDIATEKNILQNIINESMQTSHILLRTLEHTKENLSLLNINLNKAKQENFNLRKKRIELAKKIHIAQNDDINNFGSNVYEEKRKRLQEEEKKLEEEIKNFKVFVDKRSGLKDFIETEKLIMEKKQHYFYYLQSIYCSLRLKIKKDKEDVYTAYAIGIDNVDHTTIVATEKPHEATNELWNILSEIHIKNNSLLSSLFQKI